MMTKRIGRWLAAGVGLLCFTSPMWAGQAPIPEPSTIVLVGIGLGIGGIVALRRKRNKK